MTHWVVEITALAGCADVIMRVALQYAVAIWSLKADKDGRRHAIELLKALQNDGHTAVDELPAPAHKVPGSADGSSDTNGDDRV